MEENVYFFWIDRKRRILIVSFLGCIQDNPWKGPLENSLPGSIIWWGREAGQRLVLGAPVNYNFN